MYSLRTCLKISRRLPYSQVSSVGCLYEGDSTRSLNDWRKKDTNSSLRILNDRWETVRSGVHTSVKKKLALKDIGNQTAELLSKVRLAELSNAPTPAFWLGMAGLVPIVTPTLTSLIVGYSPFLSSVQLTFAATVCAFLGGIKWGYTMPEGAKLEPSWRNLGWSVVPQVIATLGLVLPHSLGYLVIGGGLAVTAFVDLTAANYPPWFQALRLALTVPVLIALFLSFLIGLFKG